MQVNSTYTGVSRSYVQGVTPKDGTYSAYEGMASQEGTSFSFEEAIAQAGTYSQETDKDSKETKNVKEAQSEMEEESTDAISQLFEILQSNHKIAIDKATDDDWRNMSDKAWDKLLEGIDDYIDAYKEDIGKIKELQEKAAKLAAANAPSDRRAMAAASAALKAAVDGFVPTGNSLEESETERA